MSRFRSPLVHISVAILALCVLLVVLAILNGKHPMVLLLIPVAAFIGPPMFVAYPFAPLEKLIYVGALVAAATMIFFGFRYRLKIIGQIGVVAGVVLWCALGFMGLGTGT